MNKPVTINGVPENEVTWENGLELSEPMLQATEFDCPVCDNPHALVWGIDVNLFVWCPAGHKTFCGDGVQIILKGF